MAEQTIKYDIGLGSVAKDQKGNLVTDAAGNLVVPIEPVQMTVNAGNVGSDTDAEKNSCLDLKIELPDTTVEMELCPDDTITNNIGIFSTRRCYFNMRELQKRYGNTFSMTVEVAAHYTPDYYEEEREIDGNIVKCKCEDLYYNGASIRMSWGDDIYTNVVVCGAGSHSATFHFNLTNRTITADVETEQTGNIGVKCYTECDCEEPEPTKVEVRCDVLYCDPSLMNGEKYTAYTPIDATYYLWSKKTTTVTIDEGETVATAISKLGLPKMTGKQELMYIAANDDRFWRDASKDATISGSKYVGTVYYTPSWDTLEWGFSGSFVPISVERYSGGCGVKLRFTPDEGDYPEKVFSGTILTATFNSDNVPADATPEEVLDLFLSRLSPYALDLISKYYGTDGEVVVSSDAADFGKYGVYGSVWRGAVDYEAWTQSPCHGEETVYTTTTTPVTGGQYGTIANETFTPASDTIAAVGDGVYSVTDDAGVVRYWDADLAIDEDEEFE